MDNDKSIKGTLRNLFGEAKKAVAEIKEVVVEEIGDNEYVDFLKDKTKVVSEKMKETFKNMTTEKVDSVERSNHYEIILSLPGITKDKIQIYEEDGILHLKLNDSGVERENKKHWAVKKSNVYCDFVAQGDTIDTGNISSKLENGVLTITVPKKEKTDSSRGQKNTINVD